jgi:hypothetical protein
MSGRSERQGLGAVREGFSRPSGKLLVLINLGLIVGVLLFDWSVFDIVFLYWAENLVIGAINVFKMIAANPDPFADVDGAGAELERGDRIARHAAGWVAKLFLIPFFLIHYGGFCFGHGIFVFALFNEAGEFGDDLWSAIPALLTGGLGLSLALLAASHLYSFVTNYLIGGEYRRTRASELMMRPYGRIIALHVTIIIGGFLAMAFGDHLLLLVVLVVLKTFVDLAMHGRERQKYLEDDGAPIMSQIP